MTSFRAVLELAGKTATGIRVPESAVRDLGRGKRVPVTVTIEGYVYRSTVAPYAGDYWIPVRAEHRTGAGLVAGQEVTVTLAPDDAPREVPVPEDLREALEQDLSVKAGFDALSYTNRLEIVRSLEEAKTIETRRRRLAKALERLGGTP